MKHSLRLCSIVLFVALMPFYSAMAQGAYKPLKSAGEIPEEFRSLTANKVQKAKAEDRSNERTKQERRTIDEFLLRNNYMIDELLTSGKILFGDSLTDYVNTIAALLLEDEPILKNKLRFYTVKSTEANAFATSQGIIFITLGLLAQIENEAQLAFILSHEIAHFQKEHSIATVLENIKVYNQTSSDRYGSSDERIRLLSSFSKEKEFEADSLGFTRFVLGGYDMKEASAVMDVLYLSSMPYQEVEFKPEFLSFNTVDYPQSFRLDSIAEFPYDSDDYDDSKSTHPNIRKRKDRLNFWSSKSKSESDKLYLKTRESFNAMQQIARNELIHLFLQDNQYIDAFYIAYVNLQANPSNRFLEESIAKSLYGITKYSYERSMKQIGSGSKKSFGEIQRCYHFFETLNPDQLNLISIRYNLEIFKKYQSPFIERLANDLILEGLKHEQTYASIEIGMHKYKEMVEARKIQTTEDKVEPIEEKKEESEPTQNVSTGTESKYEKYRVTKKNSQAGVTATKNSKTEWETTFHYSAFEPLLNATTAELYEKIALAHKTNEERRTAYEAKKTSKKKVARRGYSLGIDKVVFVDPFFMVVDERKGYKLIDSEERLVDYKAQIDDCASSAELEHDVLAPKTMASTDISRYNSMSLMNGWIGEHISHNSNNVSMIPLETEYTIQLADEYGTDYFCYTGIIASKEARPYRWGAVFASLVVPYFLPFTLVRAFIPLYHTNFYFLLYDIREGEAVWTKENVAKLRVDDGGVKSVLFDTFYQVKRQSKK